MLNYSDHRKINSDTDVLCRGAFNAENRQDNEYGGQRDAKTYCGIYDGFCEATRAEWIPGCRV